MIPKETMEPYLPSTSSKIIASFAFLLLLFFLTKKSKIFQWKRSEFKRQVPTISGAWPIIGHLHLLGAFPHITFGSMAEKYGPIFYIKFGVKRLLVVNDAKMAKACLATNDKVFSSRPKSIAAEVMSYNYAMFGLAQYGQYWREIRKVTIHELLSSSRLEMVREVRVFEVQSSVKDMYKFWLKHKGSSNLVKMEMKQWFGSVVQNYIVRLVAGKRYSQGEEEGVRFQKTVHRFFELMGEFIISDAIPCLRWLDLGGKEKEMKAIAKDMDDILVGWIDEHKRKINSSHLKSDQLNFMDTIISIVKGDSAQDRFPGFDSDTIIKSTIMNILLAATDTTTVTLIWALSLLLNNPTVMKKAREELDIHVGQDRQVEESDMKNLVYLQAIIKETLRLYPAGPLSVPHESMEDCTINGYHIPKGTRLLVNLWKIHRDEHVWSDPNEFKPDRFLISPYKDMDVRGQDFELIPFGSGRRMCPGISFALQIMLLTLGRLIHGFELERISDEAIDMKESFGLTIMKATPLEIIFKPRLSHNLY